MSKVAAESFQRISSALSATVPVTAADFCGRQRCQRALAKNQSAELIQHERSYRIALSTELECWYGIFQVVSER
jgi:hypothetical protein